MSIKYPLKCFGNSLKMLRQKLNHWPGSHYSNYFLIGYFRLGKQKSYTHVTPSNSWHPFPSNYVTLIFSIFIGIKTMSYRLFSDYFSTSNLTSSSYFSSQTSVVSGGNVVIFGWLDTSGLTGHARRSMIRSNGQRHSDQRHSVTVQWGR